MPRVLRERSIRALLAAEVVSMTGSQMTWIALPWFVLITTGSATRMSLVLAAEAIGLALFGLPSGNLINRIGARRTMLLCDGIRAPLMMLVPVLHWTGQLSFGLLIATSFALGVAGAPYFSAGKLILVEILGEDEKVITEANALFQSATRITLLLGPVTAGVLIGLIGAPSVLVVDAATYLASVFLLAGFVPQRPPVSAEDERSGILAGLRYLVHEPLLRAWTICIFVGDAAWQAIFVALPVLVVSSFDSDARIVGWLFASFGIGAVCGNVLALRVFQRVEGLRLIASVVIAQALPLWALAFDIPAAAAAGALFASGLANGIANPAIHSILTLRPPAHLRGNVMASFSTIFVVNAPIGILVAGPLLDKYGVGPVLVGTAAIQTVTMAGLAVAAFRARAPAPHLQAGSPSHTTP